MHVFITGGTGFIGSALVRELIAAGHRVTGLARTPESAAKLTAAGAAARTGELTDLPRLRVAVADADAVIHCAFIHDFANFAASVQTDLRAADGLLDALAAAGRSKIFVNTSGTAVLAGGRGDGEADAGDPPAPTGPGRTRHPRPGTTWRAVGGDPPAPLGPRARRQGIHPDPG